MKWYIGMKVIMSKMDYIDECRQVDQMDASLTSRPVMTSMMVNFDEGYSIARQMIEKTLMNFVQLVLDIFWTELI